MPLITRYHPDAPQIQAESVALKLLAYCEANEWAGYDPYDALNSKVLRSIPLMNSKLGRLALTQTLKRSPLNLRRLLRVPRVQNPKALALFLMAVLRLAKTRNWDATSTVGSLIERLISLRSQNTPYFCWGYSFPWQTRTPLVPAGAPNLVCTVFVANALLDAFERFQDSRCLAIAVSAAEYILNELYWTDGGFDAGFSYPLPSVRSRTHNVNFLAAALLLRVYHATGNGRFRSPAIRATRYSVACQHADGSWDYGEASTQRWIDNFHSGYNLCALQSISRYGATEEFDNSVRRGFEFYRAHFLRADGSVRYFHDRTYPIDIHCVAQSMITLCAFDDFYPENMTVAYSVFHWAMKHLWDERGFFYYRVLRFYTIRTSFMRWSQAWMLLAISELMSHSTPIVSDSLMTQSPTLV